MKLMKRRAFLNDSMLLVSAAASGFGCSDVDSKTESNDTGGSGGAAAGSSPGGATAAGTGGAGAPSGGTSGASFGGANGGGAGPSGGASGRGSGPFGGGVSSGGTAGGGANAGGTSGAAGGGASNACADQQNVSVSEPDSNISHFHGVGVPATDVVEVLSSDIPSKVYTMTMVEEHTHTLTLTRAHFESLRAGTPVTLGSSFDAGHTHIMRLTCS